VPSIDYPTDPQHPVITMDLTGGLRVPTPPGFQRQPWLQVFGDGRIVCGAQSPKVQSHSGHLTKEQMQGLVDWLVLDQKLLELSKKQIAQELEGYQSPMADGPTTTIKIDLAGQAHELAVYTLKQTARDLPEASGLQTLTRIEARLRQIRQLGDVGGQDVLDSALSVANKHLEQELPDADPWTTEHLRLVERTPNEGLTLTFSRAKKVDGDGYNLSLKLIRQATPADWKIEFESR
jgi:hypothetical protein